uniref:Uncharacterized protein n=1 Tax=Anopheles darlingi TaxID=43151 RepID=A0A2M4DJM9_ANODA
MGERNGSIERLMSFLSLSLSLALSWWGDLSTAPENSNNPFGGSLLIPSTVGIIVAAGRLMVNAPPPPSRKCRRCGRLQQRRRWR